jgi:WD40 repeat protein
MTEAELIILDEKGSCLDTLPLHINSPECLANWS